MSAVEVARPFVTALRSRPGIERVGEGSPRLTVRIELQERWETVAFDVAADASVRALKTAALARFGVTDAAEDFVLKLRGAEFADEQESVTAAAVRDGSSLLLAFRRRRPVR